MKYSVLKSVAHNFSHSFVSFMNSVDDGYVVDDLRQLADSNIWDLTGRRTCALVNLLLVEQDSSERLYSFAGGNDHLAIFLTESLYTLFREVDFDQIGQHLVLYRPDELPEIRANRVH